MFVITLLIVFFLAYSNGANDNFKGVATLFGGRSANYRTALLWASLTTFAGSLCSLLLANQLVKSFSGAGIVPPSTAGSQPFLLAVAAAAGLTVILATLCGFPVSTSHALIGGLVGAGWMAVGTAVDLRYLGAMFFLPLLVSPLLAMSVTAGVGASLRRRRRSAAPDECICVVPVVSVQANGMVLAATSSLEAVRDTVTVCQAQSPIVTVGLTPVLETAHFVSAGSVCFARALNDTPKIAALLLPLQTLNASLGVAVLAVAMLAGGLLNARRVAETMSHKIVSLRPEQGLAANLVTAGLVLFASRLGLPVSTTHVSVGSLFGVGLPGGEADRRVVRDIVWAWILTLPVSALLAAAAYAGMH